MSLYKEVRITKFIFIYSTLSKTGNCKRMFKRFFRTVFKEIHEENEKAKKPFFKPQEFIIESSEIAQKLINDLHEADPDHSTFDQAGLLNGYEVVSDPQQDWNYAVEHLLYMIHESDISYPRERMLSLHAYVKEQGIRNYYSLENITNNLNPKKYKCIYNRP